MGSPQLWRSAFVSILILLLQKEGWLKMKLWSSPVLSERLWTPVGEVVFSCNTHSEGNPMLMTMTSWWWIWLTNLGLFSRIGSVLVCRFWYDWLEPMNTFMPFMWIPYNGWRILICWRCLWTSLVLWYSLFALPVASPLKILSKKSVWEISVDMRSTKGLAFLNKVVR